MPGTISLGSYTIPFDEEIFAAYLQNEPDLVTDAMIQSGIMVEDPFIASLIQGGGNVYTIPFYSNLADSSDNNYDGKTDITLDTMGASHQTGVVYGRAHGWFADDFVADFTAANPMAAIAARVNKYWMNKKQARTIGMVDAVLSKSAMAANTVTKSTVGGTSLSDATQEIWGEHKRSVGLAIMHSAVAQTYEDLQRVEYLKYTDPNGVTRALQIFEINGIATIIDNGVPKSMTDATSAGVYTIAVGGTVASGDKITVNGVSITLDATSGADAAAAATALKTALEADATFNATYGLSRSSGTLTATEKSGHYGAGKPEGSIVSTAGKITIGETTAPANRSKLYDSYLYGYGALRFAKAPVTKPVETWRDPKTKGGIDMIGTRRRETIHPNGFSFTLGSGAGWTESPTNPQLFDSSNWGLAYSDPRAIMIGKMTSPGHSA